MKTCSLICILLLAISSCSGPDKKNVSDPTTNKVSLLDADKAFSHVCETKGMKEAFIEYLDSNGVLLRPGHMPIVGADAIDYLIQQNDSAYTLSWQPSFAEVAASGELGYTYGMYALQMKDKDTTIFGTYTSIWKKQSDGTWKFVLDTGNEGVGAE